MIMVLMYSVLAGVAGYLVGRAAHYWLNPWLGNPAWAPHHWIYGLLMIPLGWWFGTGLGIMLMAFGVGLFISDLADFLAGLWIGPDDATAPRRFWGID